jgi:hypothetical protein
MLIEKYYPLVSVEQQLTSALNTAFLRNALSVNLTQVITSRYKNILLNISYICVWHDYVCVYICTCAMRMYVCTYYQDLEVTIDEVWIGDWI